MGRACLKCNIDIDHKHKLAKFCSTKCKNFHWQTNNHSKMLIAATKYRLSTKGKSIRKINAAKINKQTTEWKKANPERTKELDKAYHEKMKGNKEYLSKRAAIEANRRAAKLQASPNWLTETQKQEIKQIYIECPEGFHVDHIIPLKGVQVRGLHVPWNLQCLPGIVNKIKSNKVI